MEKVFDANNNKIPSGHINIRQSKWRRSVIRGKMGHFSSSQRYYKVFVYLITEF